MLSLFLTCYSYIAGTIYRQLVDAKRRHWSKRFGGGIAADSELFIAYPFVSCVSVC